MSAARLAAAQDAVAPAEPPKVWSDTAELGIVVTSGNSETTTWNFKNVAEGKWEKSSCMLKVAALKADSTDETRFAVGNSGSFDVESVSRSETTAEAYELAGRYDRKFSKKHGVFGELGWQRNEFAGFSNRYQLTVGVASTWVETERKYFRTDAGLSWTKQDDLIEKPGQNDSWLGLRLASQFKIKVGKSGEFENDFIVDENLDTTSDLRVDMTNSFAVGFTKHLALKVSHRLLYDGDPALETVKLFDPADLTTPVGDVDIELDTVDWTLTASLVVTY